MHHLARLRMEICFKSGLSGRGLSRADGTEARKMKHEAERLESAHRVQAAAKARLEVAETIDSR